MFVSGTDCFGSPINEGYRKLVENERVRRAPSPTTCMRNHDGQKATLDAYAISPDVYEGSGIGLCGQKHQELSETV